MQVAMNGGLANWMVPGATVKAMGGAMDLVNGAGPVIVLVDHLAKTGAAKLVAACDLALTGRNVVSRIITDLAVLDVAGTGFTVTELAPGVECADVAAKTAAPVFDGRTAGPAPVIATTGRSVGRLHPGGSGFRHGFIAGKGTGERGRAV
jgi:3-oxoacid CoA-transferase subunit B